MAIDFTDVSAGDELASFTFALSAAEVRAYLDATGEDAARWPSQVPPLALGAFALARLMEHLPPLDSILHTGQQFSFQRAVSVDDSISARFTVASHSTRRGVVITAVDAELATAAGAAAHGRTTLLLGAENGESQ
ncbi:MAG: MaoC family dehydratase N-terminal domain-containing protein [Dehalococcoidia bacterium]|jgi:hypothetical protein|nr:MaoC family dehydratase N-terminal domain-containing protein [Dehalococcoidia bacterium]